MLREPSPPSTPLELKRVLAGREPLPPPPLPPGARVSVLARAASVWTSSGTSSTSTFWIVRTDGRETGFQWRLRRGRCAVRKADRMLAHSGEVRKAGEAE
jgi:hypothetical protein